MAAPDAPEPNAMKKLFLLLAALLCLGLVGCDKDYRNHRAERGKPKISVSEGMVTVRRPRRRHRTSTSSSAMAR